MTTAGDYRDQLAELAEDAGFAEGDPLRVGLMLCIACEWLEAKDEFITAAAERRRMLGLVGCHAPLHREAHSHATKGRT